MKVIFLGTPEFGICALNKIAEKHNVLACVCQPDKVGTRGKTEFCAVKKFALAHNIPLFQFEKISRDGVDTLRALKPDIMVTAAYGQILSQEVIDIAPHGIINIHGSLLPDLRGAAPIQYALLKGYKTTGVTILQTVKAVDAGDIILQNSLEIAPYENFGELLPRISALGADAVAEALSLIECNKATFTSQDESKATFTHKITADCEIIDWSQSSADIVNLVRALSPEVGGRTAWNGKQLKIFDLRLNENKFEGTPGMVVECTKKCFSVMCGDGVAVSAKVVQEENRKKMDCASFLCGNKIAVGTILGAR